MSANDPCGGIVEKIVELGREGARRAQDIEVTWCANRRQYIASRRDWEPGMCEGIADTAEDAVDELHEDERYRRERRS